jgi:MFS family permease
MTNTFGAFQTEYINKLLPHTSPSAISWIGSIQTFTMMFVGVLSGRLLDAGYLRPQLCAGIFLEVLGLIMLSISTKYWQILVSQGLCVGLGAGLLYLPGVAVPAQYFSSKVMFATGIVATGSSMGTSLRFLGSTQLQPTDSGQANAQGLFQPQPESSIRF